MNEYPQAASAGSGSPVTLAVMVVVMLAFYVYMAYSIYVMAKKTGMLQLWMAWVPVFNTYLLIKIAGKPGWWFFLLFIPLVNIVIAFMIWYHVAVRMNKPEWMGILVAVIPLLIGLLAFGDEDNSTPTTAAPPSAPAA